MLEGGPFFADEKLIFLCFFGIKKKGIFGVFFGFFRESKRVNSLDSVFAEIDQKDQKKDQKPN